MKALYFDCFSGISGDMTLGALLDLGIMSQEEFIAELNKIHVDGYHIEFDHTKKNGIGANVVKVLLDHEEHGHTHNHNHEHAHEHEHHHDHVHEHAHGHMHRNLYDVNTIIDSSEINQNAKELAKKIFERVALSEAKVHQETLENVHFHEVGAIDSIVDIIGSAILIDAIHPDVIYSSVVHDGHGFIHCAHGIIPVPVPATIEIFAASNAVVEQIDVDTELVTPTGAAIISELATSYGPMPAMQIEKIIDHLTH